MPSRMAAMAYEAVAKANRAELDLKRTPWSKTGFVNVIKVGKKYQARLQVPGDGRGGSTKRKQHSLPTLFDTAEDFAVWLAIATKDTKENNDGRLVAPPKPEKDRKPRGKQLKDPAAAPVVQQTPIVVVTTAVPLANMMLNVPIVAATPLPMQPLPLA